jgi:transketolase
MAEGSVDEAMRLASKNKLDNLVGIIDVNRLGQRGETMFGHDVESIQREVAAKGWHTIVIDGHSLADVQRAYEEARGVKGKPTMIIAKTIKGKGVSFVEDKAGWHGKALSAAEYEQALKELGPVDTRIVGRVGKPERDPGYVTAPQRAAPMAAYTAPTSVRKAVGQAVARLGRRYPNIVVLDPETGNSTHADLFAAQHPERTVQGYIAEQATVGAAVGMMRRGKKPFVFGFAAFLSRALDQVRMAQYAEPNLVLVGTHAGVHIGEDGASQMALNDIAQFRDLAADLTRPDRIAVLYPSDAVSAEKLVEQAATRRGLVYLRATRGDTPVLYPPSTKFPVGGSKTLRSSKQDVVTIVSAGVTLHEALAAADRLAEKGVKARVIDLYSIQPIDQRALLKASKDTRAIITVEDHRPAGGLGEAVMSALATAPNRVPIHSLAARKTPRSGKPQELLAEQEIDADAIVKKVTEIVGR